MGKVRALVDPTAVTLRAGTAEDARAVVALHWRCSAATLHGRYHAPVSSISSRFARRLLEPADGLSVLAVTGEQVVGHGMVVALGTRADMGVLVEDRWQRKGVGTRLVHALAEQAGAFGVDEIACVVQPDNPAVPSTVRRAGLRARVTVADGLARYRIPVAGVGQAVRGGA